MRSGAILLAAPLLACTLARAQAFDLALDGYVDARAVAADTQTTWLKGGQGKFRYGPKTGSFRFAEAVAQADATLDEITDGLHVIAVARAEPQTRSIVDLMEAYALWAPKADGDFSWSVKTGAFYPAISLENDDLGWTSPYTLTPSAINSWIGEELRTIGSEGTLHWNSGDLGTLSVIGSIYCCNDPAGILMADRGWAMDDRPTGLFERVRLPDATMKIFHGTFPARTGLFDEIDHRAGLYGGLTWQIPQIGKFSVLRYDNQGDPAKKTLRDTAWDTKFWAFGARTQIMGVTLIAQQLSGYTSVVSRNIEVATKFQSGFVLASYDLDDWRFSAREDVFQTRRPMTPGSPFGEDGDAFTAAIIYNGFDHVRLTGEIIDMDSRRGEYTTDHLNAQQNGIQSQFSVRYFF